MLATALVGVGLVGGSTPQAGALGKSARVGYDTGIRGGAGNPCGNAEHPGVTREGEAIAGLNGVKVKLTFTMRTRYKANVATAIDAINRHGGGDKCSAGWNARNANLTPTEILFFAACGNGRPSRPNMFCDTVNALPANDRINVLRAKWNSQEIGSLNVDQLCSNQPYVGSGPWARGPLRYIGWENMNTKVDKMFGLSVKMHHINMIAGADGRLRDGADDFERSYGRALNYAHAEFHTFWLKSNVDLWNARHPTNRYDFLQVFRYPVPFLLRWLTSGERLVNNLTYQQSSTNLNVGLCNTGSWIADVLDPGYGTSAIGIDQTWRDLTDLLDSGRIPPNGQDKVCKSDPRACKPFNFFTNVWAPVWDGQLPPASGPVKFPANCRLNHGKKTIKHTIVGKGKCDLARLTK